MIDADANVGRKEQVMILIPIQSSHGSFARMQDFKCIRPPTCAMREENRQFGKEMNSIPGVRKITFPDLVPQTNSLVFLKFGDRAIESTGSFKLINCGGSASKRVETNTLPIE
jgi:hypothetical protein